MNDFNQIFNLQSWQEIIQLNLTPWRLFIAIVDISLITFLIYSALRSVQGTKLMTLVRAPEPSHYLWGDRGCYRLSTRNSSWS